MRSGVRWTGRHGSRWSLPGALRRARKHRRIRLGHACGGGARTDVLADGDEVEYVEQNVEGGHDCCQHAAHDNDAADVAHEVVVLLRRARSQKALAALYVLVDVFHLVTIG